MKILRDRFAHVLNTGESRALLHLLLHSGFIRWDENPIEFHGGMRSHAYVGGREDLTQNLTALRAIGQLTARCTWGLMAAENDHRVPCLIGIPVAGATIAEAASLQNMYRDMPFQNMRDRRKSYGMHSSWIDGKPDREKHRYVIIDNTMTNGETKTTSLNRLNDDGYPMDELLHLVIVDRGLGALEKLRKEGLNVEAIFDLITLVRAFRDLGFWTSEQVATVEKEIADNQLVLET